MLAQEGRPFLRFEFLLLATYTAESSPSRRLTGPAERQVIPLRSRRSEDTLSAQLVAPPAARVLARHRREARWLKTGPTPPTQRDLRQPRQGARKLSPQSHGAISRPSLFTSRFFSASQTGKTRERIKAAGWNGG